MDPRDSGIFRLASVGSYLDALSTITDEMSLKERSNLIFLDRCLHERWGLGENVILNWCPAGEGDRKSTRLNSSHSSISYAVFCLKKKTLTITHISSSNIPTV